MDVNHYGERRNRILEAIVEAYVSAASPIGSALIARKLRSSVSSATIRNVMAELEEAGLLEQPHTSAGRVPTDLGYRVYVNELMDVGWLSPGQLSAIERQIDQDDLEVEQCLERSSEVLAQLTHQAAFVIVPTIKQGTVRQIEFVPLSVRKILCVLVAGQHGEFFASHVVEVEEPMSRDEAAALVRFINSQLVGVPFCDVIDSLERRLLAESDSFYHLVKRSLAILQHALSIEPNERLFLGGTSYIVAQPEFRKDPEKAHQILKSLESQRQLVEQVRRDLREDHERIAVRIGSEVELDGCDDCSYVAAPFSIDDEVIGGVGILGPRRMDYSRMSAWVDGMARSLTELLSREQGP